jgi:phosphoribosylaminoimidazole-succinocarboxamide synthase
LVDTKYEFGVDDETGEVLLVDEIHTPDSSRYWLEHSYEARFAAKEQPENIDKEFVRLWFKERCDPYKDESLPEAPADLVLELSRRYVLLYELITGESFPFSAPDGAPFPSIGDLDAAALGAE